LRFPCVLRAFVRDLPVNPEYSEPGTPAKIPEDRLNGGIAGCGGWLFALFFFEFSDHRRKPGLLSSGSVFVNNSLGTRLIQCFDGIAEEFIGILNVSCPDSLYDVLATIPHEGAAGPVSIPSSNVLTKSLFGTGNVWHTILF